MIVVKGRKTIYCDVDDTLLMWGHPRKADLGIDITVTRAFGGFTTRLVPHEGHANMLRQLKQEGNAIVVWSRGGHEWAEIAVKALKLDDIVDVVMTKPDVYIDDIHYSEFMPFERTYQDWTEEG